jgi:tetratricopeptide (TPR) repeat protein
MKMNRALAFVLSVLTCLGAAAQRPADNVLSRMGQEAQELMQQEKFSEALVVYDRIVALTGLKTGEDHQILYRRSICKYYLGKFEEALMDIDSFMPFNPGSSTPYVLRSFLHRNLGNGEKVVSDLNQALSMNTGEQDSVDLMRFRSTALLSLKRYKESVEDMKIAMKERTDPEGLSVLAFSYFNLGETENAINSVNRSIELDFSYLPAYLYAASFLLDAGENQKALIYARLGTMADDTSDAAWFYAGLALVNMDDPDRGCKYLNKAFYLGNDDAGYYLSQHCYPTEN